MLLLPVAVATGICPALFPLGSASTHDLFIQQVFIEPSSVPDSVVGAKDGTTNKTKALFLWS